MVDVEIQFQKCYVLHLAIYIRLSFYLFKPEFEASSCPGIFFFGIAVFFVNNIFNYEDDLEKSVNRSFVQMKKCN